MKTLYFDFYDESRKRQVPVSAYLPEKADGLLPTIVFGPGSIKDWKVSQKKSYSRAINVSNTPIWQNILPQKDMHL